MELVIHIKMYLALNNLQKLICHKTQQTKPKMTECSWSCKKFGLSLDCNSQISWLRKEQNMVFLNKFFNHIILVGFPCYSRKLIFLYCAFYICITFPFIACLFWKKKNSYQCVCTYIYIYIYFSCIYSEISTKFW